MRGWGVAARPPGRRRRSRAAHGWWQLARWPAVAPVIARASGARRAGQGRAAAKRTLDAPKRSRTIGNRSDRKPGRDHSWKVGRNTCGNRGRSEAVLAVPSWRKFGAQVRADSRTAFPRAQHARPSTSPTLTWGVSDPAGRLWGRVHSARAGSLTPLPCCDTCAGALTGRHKPPPSWLGPTSINIGSVSGLRRLGDRSRAGVAGQSGNRRHGGRGANRALALRLPPRPPLSAYEPPWGRRW